MSYIKIRINYYGDGINTHGYEKTRQNVLKTVTLSLPKKVIECGDEYGYNNLDISNSCDHIIIRHYGETLMDKDINGSSNEYIRHIESYEWIDSNGNSSEHSVSSSTSTYSSSTNRSSNSSVSSNTSTSSASTNSSSNSSSPKKNEDKDMVIMMNGTLVAVVCLIIGAYLTWDVFDWRWYSVLAYFYLLAIPFIVIGVNQNLIGLLFEIIAYASCIGSLYVIPHNFLSVFLSHVAITVCFGYLSYFLNKCIKR